MKKIILINILALALLLSVIACSSAQVVAPASDNHTYTMDEVIAVARKFDPDCRQFAQTTENGTPSG